MTSQQIRPTKQPKGFQPGNREVLEEVIKQGGKAVVDQNDPLQKPKGGDNGNQHKKKSGKADNVSIAKKPTHGNGSNQHKKKANNDNIMICKPKRANADNISISENQS